MKRIISLFTIVFFLFSSFALAQSYPTGQDYNGAPLWDYIKKQLNPLDRFLSEKSNKQFLTTVNGALCSGSADYSNTQVVPQTSFCWNNVNGGSPSGKGVQHIGVAWQVFQTNPWKRIVELHISAGTKQCVTTVANTEYYHQAFYCDEKDITCTNYISECTSEGAVIRSRTCLYPDGTNKKEYFLGTTQQFPDVPSCNLQNGNLCAFLGSTCDKDAVITCNFDTTKNSGIVTRTDCGSNAYCSQGVCVQKEAEQVQPGNPTEMTPTVMKPTVITPTTPTTPTPSGTQLSGKWSNIRIPENVKPKTVYKSAGTFTANAEGVYYLEAWINNEKNPLAVNLPPGSKCDGSKEASGQYFKLKAGQSVDIVFNTQSRDEEGVYTHILGAYSGCLDKGGQILSVAKVPIKVMIGSGKTGVSFLGFFSDNLTSIIFIFAVLIIAGVSIYMIWKKKK